MNDLIEFLRARLDDDERLAKRAAAMRWDLPSDAPWARHRFTAEQVGGRSNAVAVHWHIARWDPARVLAEVDAKRRIMEMHSLGHSHRDDGKPVCAACRYQRVYPCKVVRFLALPYAARPEYREEWAP